MPYEPPFVPDELENEETLQDRVALARKAREDAATRIKRAYEELEPDTRRWRTEEPLSLPTEPLRVR